MKKSVFLIFCCSFSLLCLTQSKNISILYEHSISINEKAKKESSSEMEVISNGEFSIVRTISINTPPSLKNDSSIMSVKIDQSGKKENIGIFKNYKENTLLFYAANGFVAKGKGYYYLDSLNHFNWTLLNTEKMIGNYNCKKATAVFRGRVYIAWYTPAIPISEGPWKLGGLPGLIVEAYDDEREVYWKLKSYGQTQDTIPDLPTNVRANFEQYKKEFNEGFKRIAAIMEAEENVDPNCIKCKTDIKMNVGSIELILD